MVSKKELAAAAALTAFSFLSLLTDARAHASFANSEVLPVPHGCGGQATHGLQVPPPVLKVQLAQASNPHAGHAMQATDPKTKSWTAGDLLIDSVWTRATPGGAKVAGGFLSIKNNGKEADRLVGFSTPVASHGELHEMAVNNGVMTMREIKGVDIKPGEFLVLKPGGLHLMFMGLKNQIAMGTTIKGTLVFEKAGAVEVEFAVTPIGAASPDGKPAAAQQHKH